MDRGTAPARPLAAMRAARGNVGGGGDASVAKSSIRSDRSGPDVPTRPRDVLRITEFPIRFGGLSSDSHFRLQTGEEPSRMATDRGHLLSGAGLDIRRRPYAPGRPFRLLLRVSTAPNPGPRRDLSGTTPESPPTPEVRIC